jgi:hypothetical protein
MIFTDLREYIATLLTMGQLKIRIGHGNPPCRRERRSHGMSRISLFESHRGKVGQVFYGMTN